MYNLASLRVHALTLISGERIKSMPTAPAESLDAWINEAYLEIQKQTRMLRREDTQNAVADQTDYDLPTDLLDRVFDKRALRISDGTSGSFFYPEERTWDYMLENYDDFGNPNAGHGPLDWVVSRNNQRKFIVMYPPKKSVTDGISLFYTPIPTPISRLSEATGITATLVQNSAVVNFSATVAALVSAGNDFGIASALTLSPAVWFHVITINSTTQITLDRVWPLANTATLIWTAADVSEMEIARRSAIRLAPAYYAYYMDTLMREGPEAAAGPKAMWDGMLAALIGDTNVSDSLKFDKPVRIGRFPALR